MRRLLACLSLSLITACATVPATMDPVLFEADRARIAANPSIAGSETDLHDLLARTDLTPDQRLDLLYLRADKRWEARFDLPGAIGDLDRALSLAPEDLRASDAARRKVFAASEIDQAQRRLAQLQNLPDWFDDKILMGDLEAAAARYRASQLTPSDAHLYLLRESGFVCDPEDGDEAAQDSGDQIGGEAADQPDFVPVHHHGPAPDYVIGAVWCSDPSVS